MYPASHRPTATSAPNLASATSHMMSFASQLALERERRRESAIARAMASLVLTEAFAGAASEALAVAGRPCSEDAAAAVAAAAAAAAAVAAAAAAAAAGLAPFHCVTTTMASSL